MIKVLILAYDFPPYVSVGGLRPKGWYNNFKQSGITPIVVTRQWENKKYTEKSSFSNAIYEEHEKGILIEAPYTETFANKLYNRFGEDRFVLIRRTLTGLLEFAQFFSPVGSKRTIYKTADQYLSNHKVDFIIASGDPFVLFHYASKLSKKHDTPWVADFRDPWSDNFEITNKTLQIITRRIERRTLKNATFITTVNPYFKAILQKNHTSKKIHIIENGYDESNFEKTERIDSINDELRITLTGNLYEWQPILKFIDVFVEFVNSTNAKAKLVFYGINLTQLIQDYIQLNHLANESNFEFHDRIPNAQLLSKIAKDNVLLLLNYYEITGTKIYDYLYIGKKILFCFDNYGENKIARPDVITQKLTPQKTIIQNTNSGIIVDNPEHLKSVLAELWKEFQETGQIKNETKNIEHYSRSYQTKLLAELVKGQISTEYKACKKCLFNSKNYPLIQLDENGVCDMCETNSQLILQTREKQKTVSIEGFIQEIKANQKGIYDCIIGLSGGADSSYLVHLAKKWGLSPLLVHIDGGWNSDASVQNIKNLIDSTNFDYYCEVLPWEEMRDVQKAFIKANVLDIDLPFDNAMMSYLYRIADKHGIKYILNGYSNETEGIMPESFTHYKLDKKNILDIHRKHGILKLNQLKFLGTFDYIYFEKVKKIRFYSPLNMIDYNKSEIKDLLKQAYNWKDYGNKHFENIFTRFYQSTILPKKFGIDKRVSHLSVLICSNQLNKEEALKQLNETQLLDADLEKDKQFFLKKLGLSDLEFEEYLRSKEVSHRVFKSDLDLYDRFKPIYSFFKRKLKLNIFNS